MGFPGGPVSGESAYNAEDPGSTPPLQGSGGSPGEGSGSPLPCPRLGSPMDGGAWRAAVHGVTGVGHD